MYPIAKYCVCPCLFNLHFTDGSHIDGVYLAKAPVDAHYSLTIKVYQDAVQVLDISDDEILAAIDPKKVTLSVDNTHLFLYLGNRELI